MNQVDQINEIDQTNQTDQIGQTNQMNHPRLARFPPASHVSRHSPLPQIFPPIPQLDRPTGI